MTNKIFYWCPFSDKVATVKAVINSAHSVAKYDKRYKPVILNTVGEWDNHKTDIYEKNIQIENLVVEALNHNLYVLSRDTGGGIYNILLNGKIVDTSDPKDFAKQINKFLINIKYYQRNRKLIKHNLKNFTSKVIINKFNNLLQSSSL